jgi:hypothetical protein
MGLPFLCPQTSHHDLNSGIADNRKVLQAIIFVWQSLCERELSLFAIPARVPQPQSCRIAVILGRNDGTCIELAALLAGLSCFSGPSATGPQVRSG